MILLKKPAEKIVRIIAWLQMALGVLFLCRFLYRYVASGFDFDSVNVVNTFIFGIVFPLFALRMLVQHRKANKTDVDNPTTADKL